MPLLKKNRSRAADAVSYEWTCPKCRQTFTGETSDPLEDRAWHHLESVHKDENTLVKTKRIANDELTPVGSAKDLEGYMAGGVFHPISGSKGYRPGKTSSGTGHTARYYKNRKKGKAKDMKMDEHNDLRLKVRTAAEALRSARTPQEEREYGLAVKRSEAALAQAQKASDLEPVGDDWSPEARKAAAEARKKGTVSVSTDPNKPRVEMSKEDYKAKLKAAKKDDAARSKARNEAAAKRTRDLQPVGDASEAWADEHHDFRTEDEARTFAKSRSANRTSVYKAPHSKGGGWTVAVGGRAKDAANMPKRFKVEWSDKKHGGVWESEYEASSMQAAHNYIADQPDGGYYRVREVPAEQAKDELAPVGAVQVRNSKPVPGPSRERNEPEWFEPVGDEGSANARNDGHLAEVKKTWNSKIYAKYLTIYNSEGPAAAKKYLQQFTTKALDVMAGVTQKCKFKGTGTKCERCSRPRSAHFVARQKELEPVGDATDTCIKCGKDCPYGDTLCKVCKKKTGSKAVDAGHNCDSCGSSLPDKAYSAPGSWSYKCPKCKFSYNHSSYKTLEEQLEAQGKSTGRAGVRDSAKARDEFAGAESLASADAMLAQGKLHAAEALYDHVFRNGAVEHRDKAEDGMKRCKDLRKGRATDGIITPDVHFKNGQLREIAGDRAHALDAYRAAATGFRNSGDRVNEAKARDGIIACQAKLAYNYAHPQQGRTRVCDSKEQAIASALERTRAGEHVTVYDMTVRPGQRTQARDEAEGHNLNPGVKFVQGKTPCKVCGKPISFHSVEQRKECRAKLYDKAKDASCPMDTTPHPFVYDDDADDGSCADCYKKKNDPMHTSKVKDEELTPVGDGAFKKLEGKLSHEKGVTNPAALAASIGRKKYGAKGMAAKAAAGRAKDEELRPVGDGARVEGQRNYEFTHGKPPRGEGTWLFSSKKDGPVEFQHNGSFGAASTEAKKWANGKGLYEVWVLT